MGTLRLRKIIFPLLLTLSGVAVLVSLGVWQVNRMAWKQEVLADIDARISAPPVALPTQPTEAEDEYLSIQTSGTLGAEELHVLVSGTAAGTGYRVITSLDTGTQKILLDKGLLPVSDKERPAQQAVVEVTGNLIWPDDVNSSTPAPDIGENIWFGRDVDAMASALGTEPVMVVVSDMTPPGPRTTLLPVDSRNIKNDHWEYAVTWFSLAAVWAVMGFALIRRTLSKD